MNGMNSNIYCTYMLCCCIDTASVYILRGKEKKQKQSLPFFLSATVQQPSGELILIVLVFIIIMYYANVYIVSIAVVLPHIFYNVTVSLYALSTTFIYVLLLF